MISSLEEQEYYYSESLEQAKKALRLQPAFPEARLLIGELYLTNRLRKGSPPGTETAYQQTSGLCKRLLCRGKGLP